MRIRVLDTNMHRLLSAEIDGRIIARNGEPITKESTIELLGQCT